MSQYNTSHPEGVSPRFYSGRVALRDLVLILPALLFLSNAYRKAIDHRPIAGSAK